jgi:hypothetical protein
MANTVLSRRVEKVVAYPPLSEMSDLQRREFHEALLDADTFEDLSGKWQAAIRAEPPRPADRRQGLVRGHGTRARASLSTPSRGSVVPRRGFQSSGDLDTGGPWGGPKRLLQGAFGQRNPLYERVSLGGPGRI